MPRFVATNPAFLFAVSDAVAIIPQRALRVGLLACMAAVQVVFVLKWFNGAQFLI
jgi:hypothetical protein